MQKAIIIIPALNPNENLVKLARKLKEAGFHRLVVVDDGSGKEYLIFFSQAEKQGCIVARHPRNLGKGAALKTGFQTAIRHYGTGNPYITADSDGQHLLADILKVAEELERFPDDLVLGVRDFDSGNVPLRSRIGNRVTAAFFRLSNGFVCPDTQTGLRGIPARLEDFALSVEGKRYEYEMNFLSDAARLASFRYVPIQTVYTEGNKTSHFRPVMDSVLVYGRFLRFVAASLTGALADYLLFYIFISCLFLPKVQKIFLATVLARIGSGIVNFLMNRYVSFHSKKPMGREAVRYGILFFCQMGVSAGLVSLCSMVPVPVIAVKIVVDTVLFFASYVIQKNWVFQGDKNGKRQK